jgi:thymidylate synthase (FAD)
MECVMEWREKVLDHGYVELVDTMGCDGDVVQAARVSVGPSPKRLSEDRSLIRYLMRHRHTSPFEMCEVKYRIRAPMFVARQWLRHRTANVNELSLRYSEAPTDYYLPACEHVQAQSSDNKQGRSDRPLTPYRVGEVRRSLAEHQGTSHRLYGRLAGDIGVARELARIALPVSIYTEWIWKIDLHNLLHFLSLRLHPHAQLEIRLYAEAIARQVSAWVPLCWEAFEDYRLNAVMFSAVEHRILKDLLRGLSFEDALRATPLKGRELRELKEKISHE